MKSMVLDDDMEAVLPVIPEEASQFKQDEILKEDVDYFASLRKAYKPLHLT